MLFRSRLTADQIFGQAQLTAGLTHLVVESGLGGESTVIKSHHNVGGLPDTVDFKELVEPLRNLFKDEVRQAGRELGLPEYLVSRQPFPGPGLGIRIIGEVTPEKVAIVQDAVAIWREEITKEEYLEWKLNWPQTADGCGRYEPKKKWRKE